MKCDKQDWLESVSERDDELMNSHELFRWGCLYWKRAVESNELQNFSVNLAP